MKDALRNSMNRQEVSYALRRCERTVDMWTKAGKLPQPIRLGNRSYWPREAIEEIARTGEAIEALAQSCKYYRPQD